MEPTRTWHQAFGPLMLGKMPSHYKDEAIVGTAVFSIESTTSPFQVLLTATFPEKWGNTNLVNTVSLISNDGIFCFALNIQIVHGNIQSTYKPSKITATSFPHSPSRIISPLQYLQLNAKPKHGCCPTRLTSEHLS